MRNVMTAYTRLALASKAANNFAVPMSKRLKLCSIEGKSSPGRCQQHVVMICLPVFTCDPAHSCGTNGTLVRARCKWILPMMCLVPK